jgi:DNA-directed RNA polymerase subunit M/transcription elongation factor TFIIS
MKLFCRSSFCRDCGVAFYPRSDDFNYLCLPHATPHLEKVRRRKAVMYWADTNWERLEEQKNKEEEETRTKFNAVTLEALQRQAENMRPTQQNQMAGYGQSPLGSIFDAMGPGRKLP